MTVHDDRPFAIMREPRIRSIPWGLIAPHEAQAEKNHYQSLRQLDHRCGLAPCEAVAVIEDRSYRQMPPELAYRRLIELVEAYRQECAA